MGLTLEERYPVTEEDGEWWIRGRVHAIWISERPPYCDRGLYFAHVEPMPDAGVEYNIDAMDLWPRPYMDWDRMIAELRDWLAWRER